MVCAAEQLFVSHANVQNQPGQDSTDYAPSSNTPDHQASTALAIGTPEQTTDQNTETDDGDSSAQVTNYSVADIDPSWVAVSKSGVNCVLCTIYEFRLRCTGGLPGGATQDRTDEERVTDRSRRCGRCGFRFDQRTLDTSATTSTADERLHDDELVRVARIVALWEQMRSIGASLASFDTKQMAAACIWLGAGDQGMAIEMRNNRLHEANTDQLGSDVGGQDVDPYKTPRRKTVVTRNGQITPPDEPYEGVDVFADEELGIGDMYMPKSSQGTLRVGGLKRQAVADPATTPPRKLSKMGTGEASSILHSSPLGRKDRTTRVLEINAPVALALFNGHTVAQVQRTDDGMRHDGMSQHEVDAYAKWMRQYRSGDCRSRATEFRRLHTTWHGMCGVCWFRRCATVVHSPDQCPHRGSERWALVTRHADVIRTKVLTKRVVRGASMDWTVSSGCWRCGLPAWRCHSFEHIPGRFFWPRVPEGGCQDEDLLRHIAGSVLAHYALGAACVVAQVKESWAKEGIDLESKDGIDWLQDYSDWMKPDCSYFALLVFELARFGAIARG